MKKTVFTFLLTAFACVAMAQPKVYYVDLKENQGAKPIKEFQQIAPPVDPDAPKLTARELREKGPKQVNLYPNVEYQTLQGIGGCFNEIGGVALMSLPEKAREEVMSNLFSKEGSAFSICRTAVGSSDFGVDAYSYSEVADDFNQDKFSIKREMTSVIPYIQLALKYNPEMKLFGSPWSPPAWMKESGLMDKGNANATKNHLKDDPRVYSAYAKYFRKYVEAYAEQGITVNRIVVQNETDISTKYPSNIMTPDKMYEFISKYMRPEFEKNKIKTEIWAGTFRTARLNIHGVEFVSKKEYVDAVDGIGIQYTSPRYIADMNLLSGGKPLMHTESVCYASRNTLAEAESRFEEVAAYINHGSENFAYWNMILDQTKKSGWGWAQNSLIVIDKDTKKVTYNPDYTVMSLMSKFIPAGAVRIASFPADGMMTLKVGDKYHIIVQNATDKVQEYVIFNQGKDKKTVWVPAKSLAAIVY